MKNLKRVTRRLLNRLEGRKMPRESKLGLNQYKPDALKAPIGSHMSDVTMSKDQFDKAVFASDRNLKPSETLSKDFAQDRANLKPKHKGSKQL